ncbi:MAG: hypothetical protein AAGI37_14120 [Planctomycetota bacterium]
MLCKSPIEQLVVAVREHGKIDDEEIIQAQQYGADAGWYGYIYTDDAAAFFDRHAELIWCIAAEQAEELGEPNVVTMIAGFRRTDMTNTVYGFKTLMAWFALEAAGSYLEGQREQEASA